MKTKLKLNQGGLLVDLGKVRLCKTVNLMQLKEKLIAVCKSYLLPFNNRATLKQLP